MSTLVSGLSHFVRLVFSKHAQGAKRCLAEFVLIDVGRVNGAEWSGNNFYYVDSLLTFGACACQTVKPGELSVTKS